MERVIVTGASRGIGAACVEAFQRSGVEVIGVDVEDSSAADEHLVLDLSDRECGTLLLRAVGDRRIDGLINNAAIQLSSEATKITAEEFDGVVAVNLRAPLLLSATLHPLLATTSGFIVNVASVHAVATSARISAYAATKGGLTAMTRALAVEWGPEVRVNAVLPGAIDTGMLRGGLTRSGQSLGGISDRHALSRVGAPEEIAEAVIFLAHNQFITGSSLVVDGGATARLSTE